MKTSSTQMMLVLAVTLAGAQACGGSSSSTGTGSVTGTVGGNSLAVGDVVSGVITSGTGTDTASTAYLVMTSMSNACATANSNVTPKNSRDIAMFLYETKAVDGNGNAPASTGSYTITPLVNPAGRPAGKWVTAAFSTFDSACSESDVFFTSGSVNLTGYSSGYAGTFDFTTDASEHVTGSFASADCAIISHGSSDAGPAACQ